MSGLRKLAAEALDFDKENDRIMANKVSLKLEKLMFTHL